VLGRATVRPVTPRQLAQAVLTSARLALTGFGLDPAIVADSMMERPDSPTARRPTDFARVERTRDPVRGDYVSTLAFRLAKQVDVQALQLAQAIATNLIGVAGVAAAEVAGPGFVNVRLSTAAVGELARTIVTGGDDYGRDAGIVTLGSELGCEPDCEPGRELDCEPRCHSDAGLAALLGPDVARYLRARGDTVHYLDVDRWTRHHLDNPVFRVRFAHVRAVATLRYASELGVTRGDDYDPSLLSHPDERELLLALAEFPDVVASSAHSRQPHRIPRYLEATAGAYHTFFGACRVLPVHGEPPAELVRARLWLTDAARIVFANGLSLLGVTAPVRL
jgi:arginyl-tRNA synthetase